MSLDGQVLVVAVFAVALKLSLWSSEEDVVGVDLEPDRKDVMHLDDSGLRLRAEARPDGGSGHSRYSTRPGLDRAIDMLNQYEVHTADISESRIMSSLMSVVNKAPAIENGRTEMSEAVLVQWQSWETAMLSSS